MVQLKLLKLISSIILLLSISSCATAQKIDNETQNKIEEARRTHELKIQNGNRYKQIPDKIFELTNLKTLTFSGSECDVQPCLNISEVPTKIKHLKNLKHLSLVMNGLKSIPYELNSIKLKSLDLSNNYGIDISNLKIPSLEILNLNECDLRTLPNSIFMMKNLTVLGIEGNTDISDEQIALLREKLPNCAIYWK